MTLAATSATPAIAAIGRTGRPPRHRLEFEIHALASRPEVCGEILDDARLQA